MKQHITTIVCCCVIPFVAHSAAWATTITIDTVPIGNAGNANQFTQGLGGVDYEYRMGTYEVSNAQYAAFLNAKAKSDPLGLYDVSMDFNFIPSAFGGITRSGVEGSFSYDVVPGRGELPVNHVNWYDAIRFANWLHNGQGDGDTETGAYTLGELNPDGTPVDGAGIVRNAGATWFLPSENEWYKAAYHNASAGTSASYFLFPTGTNDIPTAEAPPGGSNSANYAFAAEDLTEGGAYSGSPSPYGTFDQGGNLYEWIELAVGDTNRGARGGSFAHQAYNDMLRTNSASGPAITNSVSVGFRVAMVPEPSSLALAVLGIFGLLVPCMARRYRDLSYRRGL